MEFQFHPVPFQLFNIHFNAFDVSTPLVRMLGDVVFAGAIVESLARAQGHCFVEIGECGVCEFRRSKSSAESVFGMKWPNSATCIKSFFVFKIISVYLSYFIVKLSSDIFRLPILSNHFVHHEVLLKAAMRRTANGIRESTGKSREIEGQNREAQDLNFVDSNDLQPGTKVMLKSDLKA